MNKSIKEKSPLRQKDIRTGAQQERQRIINLLTSHNKEDPVLWSVYTRHVIDLIQKEENVEAQ